MQTIQDFVDALNKQHGNDTRSFSVDAGGKKYHRIVVTTACSRSSYCFVDNEGNIYKTAGWKAPAKGIRANIATLDITKTDPYTSWLYRVR